MKDKYTDEQVDQIIKDTFKDSYWAEHPDYPVKDWIYEAENDDTRASYRDWLRDKLENEEEEETQP